MYAPGIHSIDFGSAFTDNSNSPFVLCEYPRRERGQLVSLLARRGSAVGGGLCVCRLPA